MTNKTGIYFAFWERNWSADYCAYIEKTKRLGFDTLELGAGALAVLSLCSGITGLTLGVNPLNALVLGILGAPGLALLCALNVLTG